MGLYNVVLGDGKQAIRGRVLTDVLATEGPVAVARFRDAWVERSGDGPVIAIYTRTGGGNRTCYCEENGHQHPHKDCYLAANEALARHPLYLRDADDEFDSTYATFYFRVPEEYAEALAASAEEPVDMSARWKEAIERVGRGEFRPAEVAMMDQMTAMVTDPSPSDGVRVMEGLAQPRRGEVRAAPNAFASHGRGRSWSAQERA